MGLGWTIGEDVGQAYIPEAAGNTNNVAEYLAMIKVLDHPLSQTQLTHIEIAGDSQLVISQMNGEYAVKSVHLRQFYDEAVAKVQELEQRGCRVTFIWNPRECNERADAASKEALRLHGVTFAERKPAIGFGNLTTIGERLNISAIRVGKLLTMLGFRSGKEATKLALNEGVARRRFDGYGWTVDWNVELATARLEEQMQQSQEVSMTGDKNT